MLEAESSPYLAPEWRDEISAGTDDAGESEALEQSEETEEVAVAAQRGAAVQPRDVDLVAVFAAEVAPLGLLDRDQEEQLAGALQASRERILDLLRRHPDLVLGALCGAGRGVVMPESDFREKEAAAVLRHAYRLLRSMRRRQRGIRALRDFVGGLESALSDYRRHRNRMMDANVRLVMSLARRYHHPTLSYLDLIQEGMLGLMRAVEKFSPHRGIKFSTYAVWWIWQQIARAADCQGATIRTPVHWNQLRRKIDRDKGQPSFDAAAHRYDLSEEQFAAMSQSFQCLSLAAPIGADGDCTLADTLADPSESPEGAALEADQMRRLASAVGELPDREARILTLRFGLGGEAVLTLDEIGRQFGVSRERIRQLEARALQRMRSICDEQGLGELLH